MIRWSAVLTRQLSRGWEWPGPGLYSQGFPRRLLSSREGGEEELFVSVDRSKLFQMPDLPEPPKEGSEVPEKSGYTPLVKHLSDQMTVRGPMTISNFMREALMNPKWGYYTQSEVFGREGDFTTSPDVTQMYGELLGVWLAETWARMGSPPQVHLVEMGPGRGTLMADVLRAVRAVRPDFHRSVARLGLLELSERLRGRQEAAIVGAGLLPEGAAVAWHGSVDA